MILGTTKRSSSVSSPLPKFQSRIASSFVLLQGNEKQALSRLSFSGSRVAWQQFDGKVIWRGGTSVDVFPKSCAPAPKVSLLSEIKREKQADILP